MHASRVIVQLVCAQPLSAFGLHAPARLLRTECLRAGHVWGSADAVDVAALSLDELLDVASLTVGELRQRVSAAGMAASGRRVEMQDRIRSAAANRPSSAAASASGVIMFDLENVSDGKDGLALLETLCSASDTELRVYTSAAHPLAHLATHTVESTLRDAVDLRIVWDAALLTQERGESVSLLVVTKDRFGTTLESICGSVESVYPVKPLRQDWSQRLGGANSLDEILSVKSQVKQHVNAVSVLMERSQENSVIGLTWEEAQQDGGANGPVFTKVVGRAESLHVATAAHACLSCGPRNAYVGDVAPAVGWRMSSSWPPCPLRSSLSSAGRACCAGSRSTCSAGCSTKTAICQLRTCAPASSDF